MRATSDLMEHQVVAPLRGLLGRELASVDYACLPGEIEQFRSDATRALQLAGEIRLTFLPADEIFLSWCQAPGWEQYDNTLLVSPHSICGGALQLLPASSVPVWSKCIGGRLEKIEVCGWSGTPLFLRLLFSRASALAGVGYEAGFGDGDWVIARPDEPMWLDNADVLWTSDQIVAS
jgi:hypothetical protein